MENEKDALVAVTGCADSRNVAGKIYITLISKRSPFQKSYVMDSHGHVVPIKRQKYDHIKYPMNKVLTNRDSGELIEGDEIIDTEVEATASKAVANGVWFAIKARIRLGTDASALEKIENNLNTTVDNWLSEMFTHVQAHYHHQTLNHRINFEVTNSLYLLKILYCKYKFSNQLFGFYMVYVFSLRILEE